jgi:hypothetical protein
MVNRDSSARRLLNHESDIDRLIETNEMGTYDSYDLRGIVH